jgi:hypothetical protein
MSNLRLRNLGDPRATRLLVAIVAVVSWWATPAPALAADPAAVPSPALSDTSTYTPVCAEPKPGEAGCFVLARTDITARPAGAVSPAVDPAGLSPSSLQGAYNLPSGSAGAGMTVAVVEAWDLPDAESTMATYRTQFGLPACTSASGCFLKVDQNGGTSYPASGVGTGWDAETALDLDMVSAICPLCKIILVEASSASLTDLGAAVDTAVALGANAVSNSYGTMGESPAETGSDVDYNHPGVIIAAATGDCGYNSHLWPCSASSIEYPAASPWVVAVGGTSLVTAANARGWTETAWSGAGSGCSLYEPKPYWQADSGCAKRTHADISAVANPNTGVAVYDPHAPGGGWVIYGGTSASTPIVAAAYMLAGRPAPDSYPFRRLYANGGSLYDVTSGSNGSCGGSYLCTALAGYDGPTGLGTPAGTTALAPDVINVGAGTRNSCVLRGDGTLECWGYNGAGQNDVPAGAYVALTTSDDHSCAIDTAGALHCWGNDAAGMATPPGGTYIAVSAGPNASCAIDTAGALHCWGDSSNGLTTPPGGTYALVTVGAGHACAIDRRGAVTCWGDSADGKTTPPAGVYTVISAGANHTCGLRHSGDLVCWGNNSSGQTGGAAGGPWLDVESGTNGSCAVEISGIASCWGDNSHGQNSPPAVEAGRVALGQSHGCLYDGLLITCWGLNNDGQTTPPHSGATYVPLVPNRLVDSRPGPLQTGLTAKLTSGTPVSFQVTGRVPTDVTKNVPSTAIAVTGNLTIVGQSAAGYLSLTPDRPIGIPGTSTLNVPKGDIRANGVTVPLGTGGVLWVTYSAISGTSTDVVFDVTGYFTPESSGATYVPLVPNRLVDSRPGPLQTGLTAKLTSGTPVSFQVTGRVPTDVTKNVPSTAIAVTGNLTIVGQSAAGYLSLTPDRPIGIPGTSTLNVPKGDIRANGVTVPLGTGGVLWVTYSAISGTSTDVVFDVTGYFTR